MTHTNLETLREERATALHRAQTWADMAVREMKAGNMTKCNEYAIEAEREDERAERLASKIRSQFNVLR